MPQEPILNMPSPAAQKLETLRQLFPQAVEVDDQGRVRVNAEALQRALDPANPAGIRVEEDGYELRWVGIPASLCGVELHDITNPSVQERSLYENPVMPVESQIERDTVDESNQQQITVFAKLPKINIPTPLGNYNPDFGYVIAQDGQARALYLVVETKGYDNPQDIPQREQWKIDSARQFFHALRQKGIEVHFKTKINHTSLAQVMHQIDPSLTSTSP